jgi:diaminopimelate epimerase
MTINFYKYQGTGNDFVIVDDRKNQFPDSDVQLIKTIAHRRFGVGCDGFMLIRSSPDPTYDFELKYFNSDGKIGSLCGNGSRCAVKFAYDLLKMIGKETRFLASDGPHKAIVQDDGQVVFYLGDVTNIEKIEEDYFMDTGSPHYVRLLSKKEFDQIDVVKEGRVIRYNDRFKENGTNVNFVASQNGSHWIRTYERGVEDETLSCGTGTTAAAIRLAMNEVPSPISIHTLGGLLQVGYTKTEKGYENLSLCGPAEEMFKGQLVLEDLKKVYKYVK